MPDAAQLNKFYKIFSWASVAGLVLMLGLLLLKPAHPNIPYDPDAAARLQKKFAAADEAKSAGKPAQVQMDRAELNSYLSNNLELEGSHRPASAPSGISVPAAGEANALAVTNATAPERVCDGGRPGGGLCHARAGAIVGERRKRSIWMAIW